MDSAALNQYADALAKAWRADPKRSWTLTVLCAVLAIVVGRLALHQSPGLASAAAPPARSDLADRQSDDGQPAVARPSVSQWANQKYRVPEHNLFVPRLEYFPLVDGNLSDDQSEADAAAKEKSEQAAADEKKERQKLADELEAKAASLELETTMMGPTPRAMISGALVREGDMVSDFRVVKITQRFVILESQGVQIELAMN